MIELSNGRKYEFQEKFSSKDLPLETYFEGCRQSLVESIAEVGDFVNIPIPRDRSVAPYPGNLCFRRIE